MHGHGVLTTNFNDKNDNSMGYKTRVFQIEIKSDTHLKFFKVPHQKFCDKTLYTSTNESNFCNSFT